SQPRRRFADEKAAVADHRLDPLEHRARRGQLLIGWLIREASGSIGFGPSSPVCVHAVRSDETLIEGTRIMPYLMTHFWPGGTEEQYQSMLTAVHPAEGLPAGQSSHVAGPTDGGYLISVVWDSKEQSERFMNGTLLPALPVDGGF